MYKLIAIDLDETLLNKERLVCQRNVDAIKKAYDMGVKIVPCSGRGPGCLGGVLDALDINKEGEYSILANGAVIMDNGTDDIIYCEPLSFDVMKELFHFGRERGLGIQIYTPKKVYIFYCSDVEKEICMSFGKEFEFREDDNVEEFKNTVIFKILFVKEDDMPYLLSLEEPLVPITDKRVAVSFSSGRYLELNTLGVNKGVALRHLAAHLDIAIEDTMGIGDNFNDLQMIETAGLGVAVSNALDEIKAKSDYICTADNSDGAVAEAIDKFILGKAE